MWIYFTDVLNSFHFLHILPLVLSVTLIFLIRGSIKLFSTVENGLVQESSYIDEARY
jgi:hypothetical protein